MSVFVVIAFDPTTDGSKVFKVPSPPLGNKTMRIWCGCDTYYVAARRGVAAEDEPAGRIQFVLNEGGRERYAGLGSFSGSKDGWRG
jgi:hypothetical protein